MKWPPFKVLRALQETAWPILRTTFAPSCCIGATRIGLRVLQRFGIAGQPTVTLALAGNASFKRWVDGGQVGDPASDARFVGIDEHATPAAGFAGHLIITGKAQGEHYLLDLSAPQLDRPEKGIFVPGPVLLRFDRPFEALTVTLSDGAFLTYEQHPNKALSFEQAPDWRIPHRNRETYEALCGELVAAVEERVSRPEPVWERTLRTMEPTERRQLLDGKWSDPR